MDTCDLITSIWYGRVIVFKSSHSPLSVDMCCKDGGLTTTALAHAYCSIVIYVLPFKQRQGHDLTLFKQNVVSHLQIQQNECDLVEQK